MDPIDLTAVDLEKQPPATKAEIAAIQSELDITLPAWLITLLGQSNGLQTVSGDLVLYAADEIREMNLAHERSTYFSDYLEIGCLGSGKVLLTRLTPAPAMGPTSAVWMVGPGALGHRDCYEEVSPSVQEWVESGCPVPEPSEDDVGLGDACQGSVYLEGTPPISDLRLIHQVLGPEESVVTLKKRLGSGPTDLRLVMLRRTFEKACEDLGEASRFLVFRE
jgi:hypothetical protein